MLLSAESRSPAGHPEPEPRAMRLPTHANRTESGAIAGITTRHTRLRPRDRYTLVDLSG
jgi:hypothetical protein